MTDDLICKAKIEMHRFLMMKPFGLFSLNALCPPREYQLSVACRWGVYWWALEMDCWSSVKAPATNPSSKLPHGVWMRRDTLETGLLKVGN